MFLDQSPKATEIKAKINKWKLIKLTAKETTKREETRDRETVFANDVINKGSISERYKHSPGTSMLLKMTKCHYFLWLSSIQLYIYIYHIFFIDTTVDEHLVCVHILAIVNAGKIT